MEFLQSNLALIIGIFGFIATLLLRLASKAPDFRGNIGGAVTWFGLFLLVRANAFWLEPLVPDDWRRWVTVVWMLAFAYACIRTVVSGLLWLRHRFRSTPTAKIHRDVVDFVLYALATIPILKTELKLDVTTMLGTSAVLSLVLGFALQDTLGNLFSGLSLQLERPYQVGDFIQVGQQLGRVMQVAWRSTRIETVRREIVTVPNSLLAKAEVLNYSAGAVAVDLAIGASYSAPPNHVKTELLAVLKEVPLVLETPAPLCRVQAFDESSVRYQLRFFVADYAQSPAAQDEILSRVWYRFERAGIEIPFPQRVVTMRSQAERQSQADDTLLADLDVLAPFSEDERRAIAASARERRFGRGEVVVNAGDEGHTFYVVITGSVSVRVGQPAKVLATLSRGEAFGEMSLLTGEPRTATVVAQEDCLLLELDRPGFERHFGAHPERAKELAEVLAKRRSQLASAASTPETTEEKATHILSRLKQIFRVRS